MIGSARAVALNLAQDAGQIIRSNFHSVIKTEWKGDNSPVTATDRDINRLVIDRIKGHFPTHGILGEEQDLLGPDDEYVWVCDPVDATWAFCHGIPISTFSLALTSRGRVLLGIIYDPFLERMFYAEIGSGATMNDQPIRVSSQDSLKQSYVNSEGSKFDILDLPRELSKLGAKTVKLYSILYTGALVAQGKLLATVLGGVNPWDAAAIKIIVDEAGGIVTDLFGNDQLYDRKINGLIASNGYVHHQVVNAVQRALPVL